MGTHGGTCLIDCGLLALALGLCACGHTSTPALVTEVDAGDAGVRAEGVRDPIEAGSTADDPLGESAVPCKSSVPPDPGLVRACVLQTTCAANLAGNVVYTPNEFSLSECIQFALSRSGIPNDCATKAITCDQMAACFGSGVSTDKCALSGPANDVCVGSKIISCESSLPPGFFDCARLGASCVLYRVPADVDAGTGGNSVGACAVDAPCPLGPEGPIDDAAERCVGTKRVQCKQGHALGEDCAATHRQCQDGAQGAICMPTSQCAKPGVAVCNADGSASLCRADDGLVHKLDCPAAGLGCVVDAKAPLGVNCVAPGCTAPMTASCFEHCDGPIARLCVGGARLSVDCRDYGFDYCRAELRASGLAASCTLPGTPVF